MFERDRHVFFRNIYSIREKYACFFQNYIWYSREVKRSLYQFVREIPTAGVPELKRSLHYFVREICQRRHLLKRYHHPGARVKHSLKLSFLVPLNTDQFLIKSSFELSKAQEAIHKPSPHSCAILRNLAKSETKINFGRNLSSIP